MDAEVAPRALSVFPRMTLGSYLMILLSIRAVHR